MKINIATFGIFKEELKNRFLCIVETNGRDELCYIPSSCKLSNFIEMQGRTVLLRPIQSPHSRTRYEVYAVLAGKRFIVLRLSEANRAIYDSLNTRRFSFLGKREKVIKEYKVEGYKCDLFIEDTNTIVEIKSILSLNKVAHFPTVYSQRAIDQLKNIELLLDKGYRICYFYISMSSNTTKIIINAEIEKYYQQLKQCINKGLIVKGYSLKYADNELYINKAISIEL